MQILKVNGAHKDFLKLCQKLEEFQYNLMPVLKEKGYNLTEDLEEIIGFVLYDDDKPIGSIGLKRVSDDTCEVVRVFVCKEHRGKGYSKLLFEMVEGLAKELGYKKAEMIAWSKAEAALGLYKKLGYIFSEEQESEWFAGLKYIEMHKVLD